MNKEQFDKHADNYVDHLRAVTEFVQSDDSFFDDYKVNGLERYSQLSHAGGPILDFGCGVGKLAGRLALAYPSLDIHGYDVSSKSIASAKSEYADSPNLRFGREFPVGKKFSLIIVSNVLHHISEGERAATLRSLGPLLAEGGSLVIFEHNPVNPLTRLVVRRCAFDVGAKLLRRGQFLQLARECGYIVNYSHYCLFFPWRGKVFREIEHQARSFPFGAQHMTSLSSRRDIC